MTIIFLIFGLIIGSFLNSVVYRLNSLESLWGRSHCPQCKKKIRWYHNVPIVSFLVLSARCKDCGEKISWKYPIMEAVTAIIFALVAHYFYAPDLLSFSAIIFYCVIFSILLIIFSYDLQYMEIPMIILWIGVVFALAYLLLTDRFFGARVSIFDYATVSGLIGAVVAFLFFYILAAVSKEKWMGMGDAYLGILIGLIVGWPNIIITLLLSFTIGAIISIFLMIFASKTMKSQVPFAPFLVISVFLVVIIPQMFPQLKYLLFYFG